MKKDLFTKFKETFKCPICFENYNDSENFARIFKDCGHTACEACITRMLKESMHTQINCPICKTFCSCFAFQFFIFADENDANLLRFVRENFPCNYSLNESISLLSDLNNSDDKNYTADNDEFTITQDPYWPFQKILLNDNIVKCDSDLQQNEICYECKTERNEFVCVHCSYYPVNKDNNNQSWKLVCKRCVQKHIDFDCSCVRKIEKLNKNIQFMTELDEIYEKRTKFVDVLVFLKKSFSLISHSLNNQLLDKFSRAFLDNFMTSPSNNPWDIRSYDDKNSFEIFGKINIETKYNQTTKKTHDEIKIRMKDEIISIINYIVSLRFSEKIKKIINQKMASFYDHIDPMKIIEEVIEENHLNVYFSKSRQYENEDLTIINKPIDFEQKKKITKKRKIAAKNKPNNRDKQSVLKPHLEELEQEVVIGPLFLHRNQNQVNINQEEDIIF